MDIFFTSSHAYRPGPFILILAILCRFSAFAGDSIKNYAQYFATGDYDGKNILVLRRFEQSGHINYLAVNPLTLESFIISADQVSAKPVTWQQARLYNKNTPYVKAIEAAENQSFALQDAGIAHGFPKEKGITLTIDLCPSHKALDRVIFTSLITEFQKYEKPVPLALSITGRFMLTHPEDIHWLKGLVQSGDISVTWINHSYTHHFSAKSPLRTNFLLEPGTDLNFEIFGTELAMLQHGLLPSVFFRFPGLVSNRQVADKVISCGLIPVGSDAWLAKGQPAHAGSIVLIHGNGNEPLGVKDFITLLQTEKTAVMDRQWLMYDLRKSVEDEFGQ